MDIEKLKQKILDLAIRGKLVPQDPNDEPSSVLIEKIKNEKNELIKQGKIKTTKDDSYIYRGSDNCYYENNAKIDFKTKLDFSSDIIWMKGKDFIYPMESKRPTGNEFKYIDIDAINNKTQMIDTPKIVLTSQAPSRASRKVYSTSTLFSMVRPYLRNIAYVGESYKDCIASTGFYVCTPMPFVNPKYLYLLLTSDFIVDSLNFFMKGDNSPSINGTNIENLYFPILPLAKQIKTVNLVEKILQKIEFIRVNNENLLNLLDSAKRLVLDEYFGENSSYKSYYENCLLQNYTKIIMGQSPKVVLNENIENSIEFHQGKLMFTENEISYSNKYTINPCKKTNGHSILLCVRAPVGVLNYCNREIAIGRGLCSIEPSIHLDLDYLYFWLLYLNKYFIDKSTGSTFSAITIGTIKNAPFKYCSLEIQHEIKTKISELFSSLDIIKEQII